MLSGAKHLQYLLERKQMQILRFAQDDRLGGCFCLSVLRKIEKVARSQDDNPRDFFRKLLDLRPAQIESVETPNYP